jgi:TetR/AcrR family transcriptional regulator, regulator of cefoperazone and chloramphenicol sensitivity
MTKTHRGLRTDGEITRSRILEAAGQLFADTGFAETTSKAIAVAAGADQASINYHFGSRSGLYEAVLAEAHRRLVSFDDLQLLAGCDESPVQKLRLLIKHLVEQAVGRPDGWHLKVLAQELMAPTSHLQTLLKDELLPKVALISGLMSEITGIPADDPAITLCLLNVAAPCLMLIISSRGIPGPLSEILHMPQTIIVEHLHGFSLAGLQAISQIHANVPFD